MFEMTGGIIINKNSDVSKKSVRAPENMKYVEQVLMQGPRKSLKHLCQQLSSGASSAYRIIQGLKLFLYKIQMQQALHGADKGKEG
jgi:hypothetical protein